MKWNQNVCLTLSWITAVKYRWQIFDWFVSCRSREPETVGRRWTGPPAVQMYSGDHSVKDRPSCTGKHLGSFSQGAPWWLYALSPIPAIDFAQWKVASIKSETSQWRPDHNEPKGHWWRTEWRQWPGGQSGLLQHLPPMFKEKTFIFKSSSC